MDSKNQQDLIEARERVARLFDLYHHELVARARRFFRDWDTADDVVQETFLKAYQSAQTLKDINCAKAWIFTILTNTARIIWAKSKKMSFSLESLDEAQEPQVPVSDEVERKELLEHFLASNGNLPSLPKKLRPFGAAIVRQLSTGFFDSSALVQELGMTHSAFQRAMQRFRQTLFRADPMLGITYTFDKYSLNGSDGAFYRMAKAMREAGPDRCLSLSDGIRGWIAGLRDKAKRTPEQEKTKALEMMFARAKCRGAVALVAAAKVVQDNALKCFAYKLHAYMLRDLAFAQWPRMDEIENHKVFAQSCRATLHSLYSAECQMRKILWRQINVVNADMCAVSDVVRDVFTFVIKARALAREVIEVFFPCNPAQWLDTVEQLLFNYEYHQEMADFPMHVLLLRNRTTFQPLSVQYAQSMTVLAKNIEELKTVIDTRRIQIPNTTRS
jgi:DNA-directed RNA polymerase specialized sigma24 family protein